MTRLADVALFPVDCMSHNAVATVKRVSRYARKPYIALRGDVARSCTAQDLSTAIGGR